MRNWPWVMIHWVNSAIGTRWMYSTQVRAGRAVALEIAAQHDLGPIVGQSQARLLEKNRLVLPWRAGALVEDHRVSAVGCLGA